MHSAVRAVKVRIPTVPYFTDVGYGLTHCLLLCLCCRIWFNSLPALFVGLDVVYLITYHCVCVVGMILLIVCCCVCVPVCGSAHLMLLCMCCWMLFNSNPTIMFVFFCVR